MYLFFSEETLGLGDTAELLSIIMIQSYVRLRDDSTIVNDVATISWQVL